jgi:hypothetical protein
MSYTHLVKDEIFHDPPKHKKEMEMEIYSILKLKNSIYNDKIELKTENIGIAKKIYTYFKQNKNLKIFIKYSTSKSFGEHRVYTIYIPYQKDFIKVKTELLHLEKEKLLRDDICFTGYLRGVFLASGYIKSPDKEYSMDFFIENEESAKKLHELLIAKNKRAFFTTKRNKYLVYLRNSEDIMDILVTMRAMKSFFEYEEITVVKDLKNKTIRSMNWELANETKTLSTAQKQMRIIRYIEKKEGLDILSDVLKEIAKVRIENPEASLVEIADIIGITKSGVRNRFRRIEAVYNELFEKYGQDEIENDDYDDYYDPFELDYDEEESEEGYSEEEQ